MLVKVSGLLRREGVAKVRCEPKVVTLSPAEGRRLSARRTTKATHLSAAALCIVYVVSSLLIAGWLRAPPPRRLSSAPPEGRVTMTRQVTPVSQSPKNSRIC